MAESLRFDQVDIGSRVQFGRYPQSGIDPEPITWRVLDIKNGRALMISEDLLDARRFDEFSNDWNDSELRAWLHEDFLVKAFNAQEQQKLGYINGDKVTCLSVDEAKKYFSGASKKQKGFTIYPDRMAKPTAYAGRKASAHSYFHTSNWWLRSPGHSKHYATEITYVGHLDFCGALSYVAFSDRGVRPVVLVSI